MKRRFLYLAFFLAVLRMISACESCDFQSGQIIQTKPHLGSTLQNDDVHESAWMQVMVENKAENGSGATYYDYHQLNDPAYDHRETKIGRKGLEGPEGNGNIEKKSILSFGD